MKLLRVLILLIVIYFITLTLRLVNIPHNVQWWADSSRDYLVSLYLHNTGEKIDFGHYANGFAVPFHYPPNYYYLLSNFHYFADSQESMMVVYAVLASTVVFATYILSFSITKNHCISILASFLLGFSPYLLLQTMQFHGSAFVHWLYIWSLAFFSFGFTYKKHQYILLGLLVGTFVVTTSYVYSITLILMGVIYLLSKKFTVKQKITAIIPVLIMIYSMYAPVLKTIPDASLSMVKNISWEATYERSYRENIVYLASQLDELNCGFFQKNTMVRLAALALLLTVAFSMFHKQTILRNMDRNLMVFLMACGLLPMVYLSVFSNTDVPAHWFGPTLISIQIILILSISQFAISGQKGMRLFGVLALIIYCFAIYSNQKEFFQRSENNIRMHFYADLAKKMIDDFGYNLASGLTILSPINGAHDQAFDYDTYRYLSEFSSNIGLFRLTNHGSDIESEYVLSQQIVRMCSGEVSFEKCQQWLAQHSEYMMKSSWVEEEWGTMYLLIRR